MLSLETPCTLGHKIEFAGSEGAEGMKVGNIKPPNIIPFFPVGCLGPSDDCSRIAPHPCAAIREHCRTFAQVFKRHTQARAARARRVWRETLRTRLRSRLLFETSSTSPTVFQGVPLRKVTFSSGCCTFGLGSIASSVQHPAQRTSHKNHVIRTLQETTAHSLYHFLVQQYVNIVALLHNRT